jgi:hypothetical protein
MSRFFAVLIVAVLAGPAFAAATGRIVGPDGRPVPGAKVCEALVGSPENCVPVGPDGVYRVEGALRATLIVRAVGFVPKAIDAAPLTAPVKLERAAGLLVRVIDASTKVPIPSGKVMIDSPSGRRIGDFVPFNKSGVRISTLDPGDVFVRAEADGYVSSGPIPVTLVSGEERSLEVSMKKKHGGAPAN